MYTSNQVGEILDISPRTVRRYVNRYPDHLSETAVKGGKHSKYTDQDILILQKIKRLTQERRSKKEINELLRIIDDEPPKTSALALIPEIAAAFDDLRATIAGQQDQLDSQQTDINELRDALNDLKKPWYKRLFGS